MNTTSASLNSRMKSRVGIFCRRNSYLLSSLGVCSGRNEHGVLITLKGPQMLGWYCHSKHSWLGWVGYKLWKHVGTKIWMTLVYGESRSLCYAPCFCQRPERVGFTYNSWQDFGRCGESLKLWSRLKNVPLQLQYCSPYSLKQFIRPFEICIAIQGGSHFDLWCEDANQQLQLLQMVLRSLAGSNW